MTTSAVQRGVLGWAFDRFGTWFLGLSAERSSYTIQQVHIPMRDGIELVGDLYEPIGHQNVESVGLLLVQGCYGRSAPIALLNARMFAARDYRVLFVSSRGTFGSGGTFYPGRSEQADSQDIVVWMRTQPWYPGRFATVGASYLGYSQWALLHDPPKDCVAAAILVGPHDYSVHHWGSGSYRLDRIGWGDMAAHQEDPGFRLLPPTTRLQTNAATLLPIYKSLPLLDAVRSYLAGLAPWICETLVHPDLSDPFWETMQHDVALERVNIPILLVSGWYDTFALQTMEQYARLHARGCNVVLTIGPWTHVSAGGLKLMPEILDFFDEYVAGTMKNLRPSPVRIYVTGVEEWRQLPSWPPATDPRVFYLQRDKALVDEKLPDDAEKSTFTYDPADPTPSLGGPQLAGGGRVDDSAYASRSDVLVFTSRPLTEDVEILGKPAVQLLHSSDTPYVDLWVRLSEVDATGVSHNITEVYQAPDPGRNATVPLQMSLSDCAHRFRKGTRIRLTIAGGSFPMFACNPGVEGNRATATTTRTACHTLEHAGDQSRLVLPISSATD